MFLMFRLLNGALLTFGVIISGSLILYSVNPFALLSSNASITGIGNVICNVEG
jgi:hypothetical protein